MCQRCVEHTSDPRHGAFQTFGVVESLSVKDKEAVQQGQPGYVMIQPFPDVDAAKFHSFTMMQDPKLEAVRLSTETVCLN